MPEAFPHLKSALADRYTLEREVGCRIPPHDCGSLSRPRYSWVGAAGSFHVAAEHFVERHGLLVMIALGESVIAIGMGVDVDHVTAGTVGMVVLALALPGPGGSALPRRASRPPSSCWRRCSASSSSCSVQPRYQAGINW